MITEICGVIIVPFLIVHPFNVMSFPTKRGKFKAVPLMQRRDSFKL